MEEPSLLDYLKEKLDPRGWFRSAGSHANEPQAEEKMISHEDHRPAVSGPFPWRSLAALILALIAQRSLEPPVQSAIMGIILYVVAAGLLILALLKREWKLLKRDEPVEKSFGLNVRTVPLFIFLVFLFASYISFSGNLFTLLNITLWIMTLVTGLWAFWERDSNHAGLFGTNPFAKKIDLWKLLVLAVFLLSAWFHLYHLDSIPINMTSDHTEKLLDVNGILNGQYSIFFAINGGREPIQFYLTAFFAGALKTGLNFLTLKLTMTLAFLLSLVYVYKLGRELGSRWTGLFFMALLGFSSWANMITRVGLRLVLAPVFIAPVLFYFLRGLRFSRRNDFILAGIFTGLGLLGYSAFRVLPIVLLAGVVIFLAYQKFNRVSRSTWWALGLLALFALVTCLPLFRYAVEYPGVIGFRMLTRMTSAERQLPGEVMKIFFGNFWNAISMTFWKDGNTWVISVPDRPALDVVSAALYFLGLILMVYRWLRSRRWQDLLMLVSIPILMLPSILSLAFPEENPSLSRAGGALIPIFLICAIALESLLSSLWKRSTHVFGKICVALLGISLLGFSAAQNFNIALVQYPEQYKRATWNTTQLGEAAKEFIATTGQAENVWVVGVPYWVDTRLVAISAGYVGRDYAIWAADLGKTLDKPGAKLFLVKGDDFEGMDKLKKLYPMGAAMYHASEIAGQDFYAYMVMSE